MDVVRAGKVLAIAGAAVVSLGLTACDFGPVVTFHPVRDDEEALQGANLGHDGLAGYVFGRDEEAAVALGRRLRGGEIKVNGTALLDMCAGSSQSFFGSSGIGGHDAPSLFDFFRGVRIVGVDDPALAF